MKYDFNLMAEFIQDSLVFKEGRITDGWISEYILREVFDFTYFDFSPFEVRGGKVCYREDFTLGFWSPVGGGSIYISFGNSTVSVVYDFEKDDGFQEYLASLSCMLGKIQVLLSPFEVKE